MSPAFVLLTVSLQAVCVWITVSEACPACRYMCSGIICMPRVKSPLPLFAPSLSPFPSLSLCLPPSLPPSLSLIMCSYNRLYCITSLAPHYSMLCGESSCEREDAQLIFNDKSIKRPVSTPHLLWVPVINSDNQNPKAWPLFSHSWLLYPAITARVLCLYPPKLATVLPQKTDPGKCRKNGLEAGKKDVSVCFLSCPPPISLSP